MKLSSQVAVLETELEETKKELAKLKAEQKAYNRVLIGDVWLLLKNYAICHDKGVSTVKSVNRRKNEVRFTDGGWTYLDGMEKGDGWILLGRAYHPGDEDEVAKLLGVKRKP